MGENYRSLKTAELSNWTGKAYIGKRKHVNILSSFDELNAPGVYFLISDIEDSFQKRIYIGEADEIAKRLENHYRKKEWWDDFVCFISKDSNLTKAHVRYLEKVMYEIAKDNKTTIELDNSNTPTGSKLPVSDCDDMDEYGEKVIFVLKNLGIIDFTSIVKATEDINPSLELETEGDKTIFYLNVPGPKGVASKKANLQIRDGVYVLLKGSYIKKTSTESFSSHNYLRLRKQLEDAGYFVDCDDNNFLKLERDIDFNSPSAAAAIVRNSSMNGRKEWKTQSNVTLDDFENRI